MCSGTMWQICRIFSRLKAVLCWKLDICHTQLGLAMLGTRAKIPGDCSSCGRHLWQWLVWNLKPQPHIDFTFQHQKVGWFDFQLLLFGNCFALGGVVFQWFNYKPGDQSSLATYDFTSGRLLWQRCFDQTLQSLCKDQHRIFAGGPRGHRRISHLIIII